MTKAFGGDPTRRMKHYIVADGSRRFQASAAARAARAALRKRIWESHATEFQKAGMMRRLLIRVRVQVECWREWRRSRPSSGSLHSLAGEADAPRGHRIIRSSEPGFGAQVAVLTLREPGP